MQVHDQSKPPISLVCLHLDLRGKKCVLVQLGPQRQGEERQVRHETIFPFLVTMFKRNYQDIGLSPNLNGVKNM